MKLPANPYDFLIVRLDPAGGTVGSGDTTATLQSGDGSELPEIAAGQWLPGVSVLCDDPEQATLEQMRGGDWLHITGVSGDTVTMRRTSSARTLQPGEYIFISLGAYAWSYLLAKVEQVEYALSTRFGGNGVPQWGADGAPDALKVIPTSPATMAVQVNPGVGVVGNEIFLLEDTWTSGSIAAPGSDSRIDLVQAVLGTEGRMDTPSIKTGVASGSPEAPEPDSGAIPLGTVLVTSATSTITTGEITDARVRV